MSPQLPAGNPSPNVTRGPAVTASANGASAPATAAAAPPTGSGQAGSGQPAAAHGGLHRARLKRRDTGDVLDVHYNPTQVTVRKHTAQVVHPQQGAAHGAAPEYINTHTRDLSFTLTLEAWSTGKDVADAVKKLQSWLNPTADSMRRGQTPMPPTVEFEWWSDPDGFAGRLTQADATYTVFGVDGKPVRATVTVAMSELPQLMLRPNPTSGSPDGGQTTLVRDGDSLPSIAYHQYGDAALWRGLAVANHIADPTAITAGQRLTIPSPASARELAR